MIQNKPHPAAFAFAFAYRKAQVHKFKALPKLKNIVLKLGE